MNRPYVCDDPPRARTGPYPDEILDYSLCLPYGPYGCVSVVKYPAWQMVYWKWACGSRDGYARVGPSITYWVADAVCRVEPGFVRGR